MVPVPHFMVSIGARKCGNGHNRVETIVVHIDCAEAGAMYLKVLLADAYENGEQYGIFIPDGYHLTHGVDCYKQLLQRQNGYLNDIGVIAVEGITPEALVQDIIVEGEDTTLMTHLLTNNLGLKSIEETNHKAGRGK
eukprot:10287975-Ditylum_brightwellii.AAC.1